MGSALMNFAPPTIPAFSREAHAVRLKTTRQVTSQCGGFDIRIGVFASLACNDQNPKPYQQLMVASVPLVVTFAGERAAKFKTRTLKPSFDPLGTKVLHGIHKPIFGETQITTRPSPIVKTDRRCGVMEVRCQSKRHW
jgi:hypothetical protein